MEINQKTVENEIFEWRVQEALASKWNAGKLREEVASYIEQEGLAAYEIGGFDGPTFKYVGNEIFHEEGNDTESFQNPIIFLHKPTGEYYVLEGYHNSYEYVEYDRFFKAKKVEETVTRWRKA